MACAEHARRVGVGAEDAFSFEEKRVDGADRPGLTAWLDEPKERLFEGRGHVGAPEPQMAGEREGGLWRAFGQRDVAGVDAERGKGGVVQKRAQARQGRVAEECVEVGLHRV